MIERPPAAVSRAMVDVGESLATWRRLRELTVAQAADRAGVSASTVHRIEHGRGGTLENVLRVARALGVLDEVVRGADPLASDVGRLRAAEALPRTVRPRRGS